ncbi:MAG: OmpA family protein [Thermonemataceae bacterium]
MRRQSVVTLNDTVLARYKESTFLFKNVNNTLYYYDNKELKQIEKAIKGKDWDKAYPMLYEYVMRFGVENFYKDTYMIWRLAKMIELLDDVEVAKSLYRLVLKHHRGADVRNIELYYDSLTVNDKDYYVPLDYYYELVEYRKLIDTLVPPQGVLLDMGYSINEQDAADYAPSLNVNNDILLFTSKRNQRQSSSKAEKVFNEDIFYSKKLENDWDYAQEFKGLNSPYNEGSAHITRDGKTVFFARCEAPDGYGNCDLYVANIQADSTWKVRNLGANVNSVSWDSHPSLSHTEDTLYFASDRIGGFGLSDIYFTYKQKDGSWSKAKNIGPTINSRKNELSPYYHPKYDVLYFSSDGHIVNFGSFDIFKSHFFYKRWQEPINLGPLVNGQGSEYYFTIDANSKDLFYAKSDTLNKEDLNLQSFPLPMEAQPTATALFKGTLTDEETGDPFQGIVAVIDLDNGIEIAPKYLRPDGSYDFDLIRNNNYLLIITGDDFFRVEREFYLEGDTTIKIKTSSIKFKKWEFASLEFEPGKANILPEMESDLNKVALFLADHPTAKIRIAGHTDSDGDEAENLELSQARADAIKNYIINKAGFEEERIEAIGYGSSNPIVPEVTSEDKRMNRRVEFEIIK